MLERSKRYSSHCTPRLAISTYTLFIYTVPIIQPTQTIYNINYTGEPHMIVYTIQAHLFTTLIVFTWPAGKDEDRTVRVGRLENRFNLLYLALEARLLTPPSCHMKKNYLKKIGFVGSNYNINGWWLWALWSIIIPIKVNHQR